MLRYFCRSSAYQAKEQITEETINQQQTDNHSDKAAFSSRLKRSENFPKAYVISPLI